MEGDKIEELTKQLQAVQLERDQLLAENEKLKGTVSFPCTSNTKLSKRTPIKKVFKAGTSLIGQTITIAGWARTIRKPAKFTFVELNDGSGYKGIQIVIDADKPGYEDVSGPNAGIGACILATGTIVASEGKGQSIELRADEVELIGKCVPADYPISKSRLPAEYMRTIAHLRPRTNNTGAMARVRNACAMATHLFFQEQGCIYLHTPLITASDCEGAGEMFQVTTLLKNGTAKVGDVPLVKETGKPDYTQDFFAKPAFLTVSGQLNGEMYATALGKIYTFGPTFRAENSHTSRHIAEFWMIEPEIAFADLEDNMDLAEAYLKYVINYVLEKCPEDMEHFNSFVEKGLIERLKKVAETPFQRLTYTEAVDILLKVKDRKFETKVEWGIDLQSEHERYIAEVVFNKPVILTNYPKDIKAFYMKMNEDGKTVRAMDILVPKIGEIIGGSQREESLEKLEKRIEECHLDKEAYKYYLDLRRFGTCPHSGFGLGFERLVMFVTGIENIRDAIPFPRYPGHADF